MVSLTRVVGRTETPLVTYAIFTAFLYGNLAIWQGIIFIAV